MEAEGPELIAEYRPVVKWQENSLSHGLLPTSFSFRVPVGWKEAEEPAKAQNPCDMQYEEIHLDQTLCV